MLCSCDHWQTDHVFDRYVFSTSSLEANVLVKIEDFSLLSLQCNAHSYLVMMNLLSLPNEILRQILKVLDDSRHEYSHDQSNYNSNDILSTSLVSKHLHSLSSRILYGDIIINEKEAEQRYIRRNEDPVSYSYPSLPLLARQLTRPEIAKLVTSISLDLVYEHCMIEACDLIFACPDLKPKKIRLRGDALLKSDLKHIKVTGPCIYPSLMDMLLKRYADVVEHLDLAFKIELNYAQSQHVSIWTELPKFTQLRRLVISEHMLLNKGWQGKIPFGLLSNPLNVEWQSMLLAASGDYTLPARLEQMEILCSGILAMDDYHNFSISTIFWILAVYIMSDVQSFCWPERLRNLTFVVDGMLNFIQDENNPVEFKYDGDDENMDNVRHFLHAFDKACVDRNIQTWVRIRKTPVRFRLRDVVFMARKVESTSLVVQSGFSLFPIW